MTAHGHLIRLLGSGLALAAGACAVVLVILLVSHAV